MSEIRFDRLRGRDVIIAPERLHRPSNTNKKEERRSQTRVCPFCEGNEALTPSEIFALREDGSFKDESGWKTRVVPNLFKALQIEAPHQHHYGFFEYWDGFGAHEVLIDTPAHTTSMTQWSEQNVLDWLTTLQHRVLDLQKDSRIVSIIIFKNEGSFAGATQPHCHTQLIGLPLIPKAKKEEYKNLHEHFSATNKALMAFMIEEEQAAQSSRIIAEHGEFIAFCPFAAAHPFEVMISSHKALGELDRLSTESLESIGILLLQILKKLKKVLGELAFNLSLSTPPLQQERVYEASRFYITITPRIYSYGGFELESQIFINPVAPEMSAKLLREVQI